MFHVSPVSCHMSSVMCGVSPVNCYMSLTSTAITTDPLPANSFSMNSRIVYKEQTNIQIRWAIFVHFRAKIINSETTCLSLIVPKEYFFNQ